MSDSDIEFVGSSVTVVSRPTSRIRIRKGVPGTMIPPHLGIEQEFSCLELDNGSPVRQWHEWRQIEVVENDAE